MELTFLLGLIFCASFAFVAGLIAGCTTKSKPDPREEFATYERVKAALAARPTPPPAPPSPRPKWRGPYSDDPQLTQPRDLAGAAASPANNFFAGLLAGAICLSASAAWANDGVGITGPEAVPAPGFPCTLFLQGELPEGTEIGWDVKPRREGVRMIRPSKDGRSADLTTLASLRDGWQITTAIHEPGKPIYFRSYVVFVPGQPYTPPPTPSPPVPGPPQPPGPPIPPGPAPAPEPSFPNERFGVSTKTLNLVSAIKSENRAGEILCLLSGCKDLLEQIKEKKLTGPVAIIKAMGALLDRCTTAPWDPPREQLANKIQELYQQGRLQSDSDWSDLATELQDGLKAVPAK